MEVSHVRLNKSEAHQLTALRSVNSLDELRPEDVDVPTETWVADLTERINQITDRKRSSVQGREESLHEFTRLLIIHYAQQEIQNKVGELVPAILKSIKGGQSERETIVALKGMLANDL